MRKILKVLIYSLVLSNFLGIMNYFLPINELNQHFSCLEEIVPYDLPDRH
ncbi:hypothetical protein J2S07_003752 [Robertmurraya andreesenii]|uniref:Cyclic lactone autoinducer peptide n=1 Tax=Anoxybacillus andreesenii TaxID=1325932 RepID=A0ABT9V8Y1_9BACL|nr:hypothetical protein [Robertmurraya andreesenii]